MQVSPAIDLGDAAFREWKCNTDSGCMEGCLWKRNQIERASRGAANRERAQSDKEE